MAHAILKGAQTLVAFLLACASIAQAFSPPAVIVLPGTNITQIGGVTLSTGPGTSDAGTIRAILSSDSPTSGGGSSSSTSTIVSTGSITAFQGGTWTIATTPPAVQQISVAKDSTTAANPTYIASASTIPISVAVLPALIAGTANIGTINGSTIAITNVLGSTITAVLTNSAVTVNGSTLTVVGVNGAAVAISAASLPSHAVTNAGTFPVQMTVTVDSTTSSNPTFVKSISTFAVTMAVAPPSTVTVVGINGAAIPVNATLQAGTASVGTVNMVVTVDSTTSSNPTFVKSISTFAVTMAVAPPSTVTVVGINGAAIPVNSTLSAETTKVIGTVNVAGSQTIAVTNTGTFAVQIPASGSTMTVVGVGGAAIVATVNNSTVAVVGPNGTTIPVNASIISTFSSVNPGYVFGQIISTFSIANPGYVFISSAANGSPVGVSTAGSQSNGNYLGVQEPKDTGRTVFVATFSATGVVIETIMTGAACRGMICAASATSFGVTSGKRLRLQSWCCTWRNNTAAAGGVTCALRGMPTGTTVATSPLLSILNATMSLATIGSGASACADFPDGFELTGSQTFGVSQAAVGAVNGSSVTIHGYEY